MNLVELVRDTAQKRADVVALRAGDETITYDALVDAAARCASGLAGRGVAPGDRVGIACANDISFAIAYLGVLHAGGVAVPLNPAAPAPELARELTGVGASLVLAAPTPAATVKDAVPTPIVVTGEREWNKLLRAKGGAPVARGPADVAVLVYTSGTSGAPKAATLTHGNLVANIQQVMGHPGVAVQPDDVGLGVLPLFHIYGLNAMLGISLAAGASLVLLDRFDPTGTIDTIARQRVTFIPGVPAMYGAWLATGASDDSFRSVRLAVSGAAALPATVQREFRDRFGVTIAEGYGLTEAAPVVTSSASGAREGSIGTALPGVEVRLVDADGDDALAGDPGEIWVRGPNVFAGYWNDADATARVLTPDGWLRTGDIAWADDDGYLFIVDRSKDLIIVSGFNVFPAEVEAVLIEHPSIEEVAVVGMPDERTGEAVKAYVVLADRAPVSETELIAYCAQHLARYKCPTRVEFAGTLPHGLTGKVLRRELR